MSAILGLLAGGAKLAVAGAVAAGTAAFGFSRLYHSDNSVQYMGEKASFDAVLDRELGYKLSALVPLARQFMVYSFLDQRMRGLVEPQHPARRAIELAPHLHLGYSWMAMHSAHKANAAATSTAATDAAEDEQAALDATTQYWLGEARRVLAEHPAENEPLRFMLPQPRELLARSWAPELRECVPGRLWYLREEFRAHSGNPPMDAAASVLRLDDGSLVIVNPVDFSAESVSTLNGLGPVRAVVSPCVGHTVAMRRCQAHWPDATYYHVKPPADDPLLRPFEPSSPPFGDELQLYRLHGQQFAETVLYHPPTRSLLGLTDTVIASSQHTNSAGFGLYALALGMWRGPHTTRLAVQNYNHLFLSDRARFRESLRTVLALDIEHVTLGHGGYLQGVQAKHELGKAFAFVLEQDPASDPSKLERIWLSMQWLGDIGLGAALLRRLNPFATRWPDPPLPPPPPPPHQH
jgi:hypothetical protein